MPLKGCAQDGNVAFKWNGRAREDIDGNLYYNSCSINGQVFYVKDDVVIAGENGKSYICKIKALYKDPSNEEPNRAEVNWYFRFNELPRRCRRSLRKLVAHEKELFKAVPDEDGSCYPGVIEDLDAETIASKSIIKVTGVNNEPPQKLDSNEYFVRYGFQKTGELCDFKGSLQNKTKSSIPKVAKLSSQAEPDKVTKSKQGVDEEMVASKRNKETLNGKEVVNRKAKQISSREALGELLKDSDGDSDYEDDDEDDDYDVDDDNDDVNGNSLEIKERYKGSSKNVSQKINVLDTKEGQRAMNIRKEAGTPVSCSTKDAVKKNMHSAPPIWSRKLKSSGDSLEIRIPQQETLTAASSDKKRPITRRRSRPGDKSTGKLKIANISKEMENHVSDDDDDDDIYIPSQSESDSDVGRESDESSYENGGSPAKKKLPRSANIEKRAKTVRKKSIPKTPTTTPRRSYGRKLMTPSISDRSIPCATPRTPLERARQRLHVSSIPDSLPCREEEFAEVYAFIEGKLNSDLGGCMYISGVPGTGKTATVHEVIHELENERDHGSLPTFRFIEINGMKLTEANQAYSYFLKALTGQKTSAEHAASVLEKYFTDSGRDRDHVILLVDELDLLWTRKQNVMYNLFEWPTRKHAKLIVVAVANTMDLPERIMMNRISSRLGLTRMTFQPYSFKQLQEIVYTRIKGIEVFEEDAMQLIARKVAAVSGDARRCLDICRRAVEIAETETVVGSPRKKAKGIVGMRHVNEALSEMFSSPKIIALRSLSKFQGFFMRSVVSEFRRSGLEEAAFKDIYDQFQDLCRIEGVPPPNASEGFRICNMLGACKLLLIEPGYNDIYQRVRLSVSQDDVLFAMKETLSNI